MSLNEWFEQGLTRQAYFDTITDLRDNVDHIYKHFSVPQEDVVQLQRKSNLRAIVLAEGWCGHCMLDIPIFSRIAEAANIDYRFLRRDENLTLMDQYETNGKRFIPIIIFIDQDGNEVAKWGPMAPEIESYVNKGKETLPPRDSEAYEEAFRTFVTGVAKNFVQDQTFWQYVYDDMKEVIVSA